MQWQGLYRSQRGLMAEGRGASQQGLRPFAELRLQQLPPGEKPTKLCWFIMPRRRGVIPHVAATVNNDDYGLSRGVGSDRLQGGLFEKIADALKLELRLSSELRHAFTLLLSAGFFQCS